jgi:hypothetical protein
MTEVNKADNNPRQQLRSVAIELLQILSLLAFAAAWASHIASATLLFPLLAVVLGVILFFAPLPLLHDPEPQRYNDRPGSFKITRERLRTLKELNVPMDILLAIDESILDVNYYTSNELSAALYRVLGEARVQPWSAIILRHAEVYSPPPPEWVKLTSQEHREPLPRTSP